MTVSDSEVDLDVFGDQDDEDKPLVDYRHLLGSGFNSNRRLIIRLSLGKSTPSRDKKLIMVSVVDVRSCHFQLKRGIVILFIKEIVKIFLTKMF